MQFLNSDRYQSLFHDRKLEKKLGNLVLLWSEEANFITIFQWTRSKIAITSAIAAICPKHDPQYNYCTCRLTFLQRFSLRRKTNRPHREGRFKYWKNFYPYSTSRFFIDHKIYAYRCRDTEISNRVEALVYISSWTHDCSKRGVLKTSKTPKIAIISEVSVDTTSNCRSSDFSYCS